MPYIGTSPSNGVRRVYTYTASGSQTTFTGASNEGQTLSYVDTNYIDVYQNGVLLGSADYTSTSGTSVVLATGATLSDIVVIIVYDVFSVADVVSKTSGGTFDGNITAGGNLTVTGTAVLSGLTHPTSDGSNGQFLKTNGSGTLSFDTAGITGWSNNGSNNDLLPANASAGIYLGVNSATAANLLDDYEEGTWTPTFLGDATTASASTQVGNYVKISNYVWASFNFVGSFGSSSNGSSTGIGGLPFSIMSGDTNIFGCTIGHIQSIDYSSSFDFLTMRAQGGDSRANFIRNRRGNTDGLPESTVSGDSLSISGTIHYKTG